MNHIPFETLLKKAEELKKQGANWHFHMIGPQCIFNRLEDQYEIFIENEGNGKTWSSLFNERPVDETRQMARMAYGENFLNNDEKDGTQKKYFPNDTFSNIMVHAGECNENHDAWHNHHLLPECILNSRKGVHCIVFENETKQEHLFAYFDEDPVEELSRLEDLYFNK